LNEAAGLTEWLDSIDGQIQPPDEIVIVDGGSRDGTLEALQDWSAGRSEVLIVSAPGANIAQGRNLAIARCQGEIIAVTDAGVTLDPSWLERLVAVLVAHSQVDVAAGFFVAEARNVFERSLGATTLPTAADVDPTRFLPSSRSVAFRRAAWNAVGGYPAWLDYCEDVVFDLALRGAGHRFVWVPGALAHFRPRPSFGAFCVQYYRYARGDGKADLWRRRHLTRYAVYLLGLPLLWSGRRNPVVLLMGVAAGLLYVRRPVQRLLAMEATPSASIRQGTGGGETGLERSRSAIAQALLLIPVIRIVGDIAKMLGYPAGVAWRLRRGPQASSQAVGDGSDALTPTLFQRETGSRATRSQAATGAATFSLSPRRPITLSPSRSVAPSVRLLDLSVIIVSYNTRERLRACLATLEQSVGVPEMETFVVDNASTDGSAAMVQAGFPRVKLIRSPRNGGYAYANNLALHQSSGRSVLLLNPDTELGPTALSEMLAYLHAHPEAAAVGPKLVRADGSLDLACRRSFPTPEIAFYRICGLSRLFPGSRRFGRYNLTYLDPDVETEVDALTGAFMLLRREAIEQVGLLDEQFFMYGEDLDWAYRLKEHGWQIRYNPTVTVLHHKGESSRQSAAHATVAFYRAMHLFYAKHYRARTGFILDWLILGAIYGRLGWSLVRNALRPSEERRVAV
jgi:hypothetical protein